MAASDQFPDDGPDDDLREAHLLDEWRTRRETGLAGLQKAAQLLESGDRQASEVAARGALSAFASALNWAEFGPNEDQAHRELDEAGRWVRLTFGCRITRDGTDYRQTCPVALGHTRIGFSVGGVATRICGLCGGDLSECPHQRGRAYLVPGGVGDLGWCRVCGASTSCEHSPQQTYRASVIARIVKMDLEEVSLVSRPAHPDARMGSMSISHIDLREALGEDFVPGVDVVCSRCLTSCPGLSRRELPHG
jgi:hypothetical protein